MNEVMPSGLNMDESRAAVRGTIKSVRQQMREMVAVASRLAPSSKLARKASVLMLDYESLDDRIGECGGEENLVFMLCAQVASGVSLKVWCEHYGVDRGLVWALLSENKEWLDRYYRAQEGMADEYVGEVVQIADSADNETIQTDKLRIDTRFKVAAKYAGGRFGENRKVEVSGTVGLIAMLAGLDDTDEPQPAPIDVTPTKDDSGESTEK